jgi:hypothetical protein
MRPRIDLCLFKRFFSIVAGNRARNEFWPRRAGTGPRQRQLHTLDDDLSRLPRAGLIGRNAVAAAAAPKAAAADAERRRAPGAPGTPPGGRAGVMVVFKLARAGSDRCRHAGRKNHDGGAVPRCQCPNHSVMFNHFFGCRHGGSSFHHSLGRDSLSRCLLLYL